MYFFPSIADVLHLIDRNMGKMNLVNVDSSPRHKSNINYHWTHSVVGLGCTRQSTQHALWRCTRESLWWWRHRQSTPSKWRMIYFSHTKHAHRINTIIIICAVPCALNSWGGVHCSHNTRHKNHLRSFIYCVTYHFCAHAKSKQKVFAWTWRSIHYSPLTKHVCDAHKMRERETRANKCDEWEKN